MAISSITSGKNGPGGPNNGNSGGMDFSSQLQKLKEINEEATRRSIELRATYTDLNSKKKAADERVN